MTETIKEPVKSEEQEEQEQTEAEKKKAEEALKRAPAPEPRKEIEDPSEEDALLKDIFLDYKAQLGDKYDISLDKEPLRTRVMILRQAVKLTATKEQSPGVSKGGQQQPPPAKRAVKTLLEINNAKDYDSQIRGKNSTLKNSLKWRGIK